MNHDMDHRKIENGKMEDGPMDEGLDPKRDDLLLQRRLDGELRPSEREELKTVLGQNASLRQQERRNDLQSEFFQADRDSDLPPPLALDFADRVMAGLDGPEISEPAGIAPEPVSLARPDEETSMPLGPWILAAAVLLAVLLVGQFVTKPTQDEEMRAGTRQAEKILRELDRSPEAGAPGLPAPAEAQKR